jgi:AcrR family transcriptional regulator
MTPSPAHTTPATPATAAAPAPAGDDPVHRGGRPRDAGREQAILDSALAVLADVGYDRMTVEAVAVAARASKATIYRRWPGKAELVVEALRRVGPDPEDAPADTGSLRGDLLAMAALSCAHIDGMDGRLLCGLAGAARLDPDLAAALKRKTAESKAPWLAAIVARAAARGEVASGTDPDLIFELVLSLGLTRALQGDRLDDAFTLHVVDDILLPVLRHHPPTPHP